MDVKITPLDHVSTQTQRTSRTLRAEALAPYLFILPFGVLFILFFILPIFYALYQSLYRSDFRVAFFVPFAIPGIIAALLWAFFYQPVFSPIVKGFQAVGLPGPDFLGPGTVLWSIANIAVWTYAGYNMLIIFAALQAKIGRAH